MTPSYEMCEMCNAVDFDIRFDSITCRGCFLGAASLISFTRNSVKDELYSGDSGLIDNGTVSWFKTILNDLTCLTGFYSRNNEVLYLPEMSEKFKYCLRRLEEMKKMEVENKRRLDFLSGYFGAVKYQIHCDIQITPGISGSPIPVHRALLARRSKVFRIMLEADLDKCMTPSNTILLPEFSHEELEFFIEFLYEGEFSKQVSEKLLYTLSVAAHKYEVPFMFKYCEKLLIKSINSNNALDLLDMSNIYFMMHLKEGVLSFIINNIVEISTLSKYDSFLSSSPELLEFAIFYFF